MSKERKLTDVERISRKCLAFSYRYVDYDGGMFEMIEAQICDAAFFFPMKPVEDVISNITVLVFLFRGV